MGLKYAFSCAVLGFTDCMFGFVSFIYLNIAEYRHYKIGSGEEVLLSYILGIYGFIKGLGLCIPAAQLSVENGLVALGKWAGIIWLILSVPQLALCVALMYNFIWPMRSHMMSDIFLFVLRNVYMVFLVAVAVFVVLLLVELEPYIPKVEKKPKVRRNVKKNATGTAHTDTSAATNGNQHDSDTESGA